MLKGFKDFIMKGNVVDLAVGIVIGTAFGAVVTSFVTSFINPIVKLILPGGAGGEIILNEAKNIKLEYGAFITQLITFVATAAAVYFVVVVPMNGIIARRKSGEEAPEPTDEEARHAEILAALNRIAAK